MKARGLLRFQDLSDVGLPIYAYQLFMYGSEAIGINPWLRLRRYSRYIELRASKVALSVLCTTVHACQIVLRLLARSCASWYYCRISNQM